MSRRFLLTSQDRSTLLSENRILYNKYFSVYYGVKLFELLNLLLLQDNQLDVMDSFPRVEEDSAEANLQSSCNISNLILIPSSSSAMIDAQNYPFPNYSQPAMVVLVKTALIKFKTSATDPFE